VGSLSSVVAHLVLVRSMRVWYLLAIVSVSATALAFGAREQQYASPKDFFTSCWRMPQYPYKARARHEQGEGRFRLYIDKTGRITDVKAVQSTGHSLLDEAAIAAFKTWKATPGLRRQADIPVTFYMPLPSHPAPAHARRPLIVREFTD